MYICCIIYRRLQDSNAGWFRTQIHKRPQDSNIGGLRTPQYRTQVHKRSQTPRQEASGLHRPSVYYISYTLYFGVLRPPSMEAWGLLCMIYNAISIICSVVLSLPVYIQCNGVLRPPMYYTLLYAAHGVLRSPVYYKLQWSPGASQYIAYVLMSYVV